MIEELETSRDDSTPEEPIKTVSNAQPQKLQTHPVTTEVHKPSGQITIERKYYVQELFIYKVKYEIMAIYLKIMPTHW